MENNKRVRTMENIIGKLWKRFIRFRLSEKKTNQKTTTKKAWVPRKRNIAYHISMQYDTAGGLKVEGWGKCTRLKTRKR
jgi:hypothetical protein